MPVGAEAVASYAVFTVGPGKVGAKSGASGGKVPGGVHRPPQTPKTYSRRAIQPVAAAAQMQQELQEEHAQEQVQEESDQEQRHEDLEQQEEEPGPFSDEEESRLGAGEALDLAGGG